MRLLRFIPIQITLVLILGIVLGNSVDFGITIPISLCILLVTLLGVLFFKTDGNRTTLFALVGLLLTFCIGILSISTSKSKHIADHYTTSVADGSQTWHLKITETLKQTSFSQRSIAKVITVDEQRASGQILINFPIDTLRQALQIDDELVLSSELAEINAPLNPNQFDYKAYMGSLGIDHQLRSNADFVMLENPSRTIYGRAASLRAKIISKLNTADFGEAELSIIQALLLGQRDDISEATYNNYKNAGAVHILAVSGLHIGILLLLLQFLFKPLERLPRGKTIKLIVIVILLWGFALLAGFSASIVRAVTMFTFVAYAMYLNRPSNTFNILALSMFFILLIIDPRLLFQVGFQMSYAAVFAIVWIYPLLQKLWYPKNKIARKLWQLFSVSVAAQLGVLPISLFYFHQFPGLFFVSNLVIVPALGIILGAGILVILLALLNVLPDGLVTLYDTLIRSMNRTIAWLADQEAFVFKNISFDAVQLVLAYAIIIGLAVFLTNPNFKKAWVAALAILGFQGYTFYSLQNTRQKESVIIAHQTRHSVLLHQSGEKLVVYAQDSSSAERLATDYHIAEGVTSIENKPLLNSYEWDNKTLFRIDSSGVIPARTQKLDYLLLTESPKLNLERLVNTLRPKLIIADGSNYRSYIERWKKTCVQEQIPFHYTGEKGAYYLASAETTK